MDCQGECQAVIDRRSRQHRLLQISQDLPDVSARRHAFSLFLLIHIALLVGCKAPSPLTINDLNYPVLVLFEQSGGVRHDDARDLSVMSVQRVMASNSPPFLIDSHLDIYRLDKLGSEHSGLWLMANPNGQTEVHFDLQRVSLADVAKARQLILARDPTLRSQDGAPLREKVEQARTLKAMLEVIGK